jgi:hypothetical protein
VAAGGAAIKPELVLQAGDVCVANVEEVGGLLVGGQFLLLDFAANCAVIFVPAFDIIDRDSKAIGAGMLRRYRPEEVRGEGGDAAFAREIITDKSDFSNFRCGLHGPSARGGLRSRPLPVLLVELVDSERSKRNED